MSAQFDLQQLCWNSFSQQMPSITQMNILAYFYRGCHYFGDSPYLESPSRTAGSQKTSCKRNKAVYFTFISAFHKDGSLKYQRPSVRNPWHWQWMGIKGDWYNKQCSYAIRKYFCPVPLESNFLESSIYVSFLHINRYLLLFVKYYIWIDIIH